MELDGFPYEEIVFGKDGRPVDPARRGVAPALVADPAVTDLLFLCHGWMEDAEGARARFRGLVDQMRRIGSAPPGLGIVLMLWPSEKFGSSEMVVRAAQTIEEHPAQRAEFVETVRAWVTPSDEVDPGDRQNVFFQLRPAEVFDQLAGADGIMRGIDDVLNLATYYEMKSRAGSVGVAGLRPILDAVRMARPGLRMHLCGHSFGARALTAALASPDAPATSSLTLLQGAFTHYGFAVRWDGAHDGVFRAVVSDRRVAGPIAVTYSRRDEALHVAYALASRLAGQDNSLFGVGGKNDKFGAIGANGAQRTPEARWLTLPALNQPVDLAAGCVCNLDGTAYIKDHFSVSGPEVAQMLLSALTTH